MRKDWQYLKYMVRHKWFVLVAGLEFNVPLWRLFIHDWTKFKPSEWVPYRELFYGQHTTNAVAVREAFQYASFRHVKVNKHHWNYWVGIIAGRSGTTDEAQMRVFEMPDTYVREMLADWYGAGRAVRGTWSADEWYNKNQDHMLLHSDTRILVEKYLDEIRL